MNDDKANGFNAKSSKLKYSIFLNNISEHQWFGTTKPGSKIFYKKYNKTFMLLKILKMFDYTIYNTKHSVDTAHGKTAVILKKKSAKNCVYIDTNIYKPRL